VIVVASPALDDDLGLAQSVEDLAVEQLIAKAGVEALDVHRARSEPSQTGQDVRIAAGAIFDFFVRSFFHKTTLSIWSCFTQKCCFSGRWQTPTATALLCSYKQVRAEGAGIGNHITLRNAVGHFPPADGAG
jgi:hypothetical protein